MGTTIGYTNGLQAPLSNEGFDSIILLMRYPYGLCSIAVAIVVWRETWKIPDGRQAGCYVG